MARAITIGFADAATRITRHPPDPAPLDPHRRTRRAVTHRRSIRSGRTATFSRIQPFIDEKETTLRSPNARVPAVAARQQKLPLRACPCRPRCRRRRRLFGSRRRSPGRRSSPPARAAARNKIGKDAKGHDRAPQQHAKQKIVAFPIQTIRHKPLRIEFAPQSMFYRRAGFPWRLWLRLTWIKEKDQSPA